MTPRTLTAWWDDGSRVGDFVEGDDRRVSDDDWILCGTRQLGLTARYARKQLSQLRDHLRSALTPVADRILETKPQAEPAISATTDCLKRTLLQV